MAKELTEDERQLLAREVAADTYENGSFFGPQREAFRAGWDAAMKYNDDQSLSNSSSESD